MGLKFGLKGGAEPTLDDVHAQQARRPSAAEAIAADRQRKSVSDKAVTGASQITTRQSIIPVTLVTVLFFLWVCLVINIAELVLLMLTFSPGLRLWTARCLELALPGRAQHHSG